MLRSCIRPETSFIDAHSFAGSHLVLDCEHPFALHRQQSQIASRIGPCVDINSVRSNIGFGHGRMAVHNEFAKVLFTFKELMSDPKQVFFALLPQRYPRPDAGVRKEEVSTKKACS